MGRHILVSGQSYELLLQQRREGYPIKRLADEAVMEKYGHLLKAAEAAAVPAGPPMGQGAAYKPPLKRMHQEPLDINNAIIFGGKNGISEAIVREWWEANDNGGWRDNEGKQIRSWKKWLISFFKINYPDQCRMQSPNPTQTTQAKEAL